MSASQNRWSQTLRPEIAKRALDLAINGASPAQILRSMQSLDTKLQNHLPHLTEYFWAVFKLERSDLFPSIDGWLGSEKNSYDDEKLNEYLGPMMTSMRSRWGVDSEADDSSNSE